MVRIILTSAILMVVAADAAWAQRPADRTDETRAEVNFVWAIPQNEFSDRLDAEGLGFTAFFGGRVPDAPIVLGTELGLINYGAHERLAMHEFGVPLEVVHVEQTNNILMGHLVLRLQPNTGAIQPYVDLLGGLKYFLTRTRVNSDVVVFREGFSSVSNFRDAALSYGFGGGLELSVLNAPLGWDGRTAVVSLHGGVRYLLGAEAKYLREGSPMLINGRFVFDSVRSRTDLLVPHFGIRVRQ